jgi:hypothetical protein
MSTTAAKPATTPIPVQLSDSECTAFLLPPLAMPKRGPKCTLGSHRVLSIGKSNGLFHGQRAPTLLSPPALPDASPTPAPGGRRSHAGRETGLLRERRLQECKPK